MRITLVIDHYSIASLEAINHTLQLSQMLMYHGHSVRLVCPSKVREMEYPLGVKNKPMRFEFHSQLTRSDWGMLREAMEGADLVHFTFPFSLSVIGKGIADELDIPSTASYHLTPMSVNGRGGYSKLRQFYNQFDRIHCPNPWMAKVLENQGFTSTLHIIGNGVDERYKPLVVSKPEDFKNKFILLVVGGLTRNRRHDLVIEAVKDSKYESEIQVIFAGSGPQKAYLARLGRGLTNPIQMRYFIEDELVEVMNYSDLYIQASDHEEDVTGCIEAFSCGLVPLLPNYEGHPLALSDLNLFSRGDAMDIRDKIDYFLDHPEVKLSLSEAYLRFATKFSLEHSVRQIERMFKQAIVDHQRKKNETEKN